MTVLQRLFELCNVLGDKAALHCTPRWSACQASPLQTCQSQVSCSTYRVLIVAVPRACHITAS